MVIHRRQLSDNLNIFVIYSCFDVFMIVYFTCLQLQNTPSQYLWWTNTTNYKLLHLLDDKVTNTAIIKCCFNGVPMLYSQQLSYIESVSGHASPLILSSRRPTVSGHSQSWQSRGYSQLLQIANPPRWMLLWSQHESASLFVWWPSSASAFNEACVQWFDEHRSPVAVDRELPKQCQHAQVCQAAAKWCWRLADSVCEETLRGTPMPACCLTLSVSNISPDNNVINKLSQCRWPI